MTNVLETERMVLRRMQMSDVDDLMGIFSDLVAMRCDYMNPQSTSLIISPAP